MKKINKKDLLAIIIFIFTFLVIYFLLTKDGHLFASKTDFVNQHYLIPDYFRKLFYETKDIFPDFAFNLGGGQNIYYFSYYGLLNPIILISYLFPFIKMIDYMIISNSLIVIISTTLFYFYLKKNNYNFKTCLIVSFLFLCSGPLIFHAHRHVMFINYMPFLVMGFYGIDKYIRNKKIGLLTISIALMILTSYYYSVAGLIVLFLLFIYKYLKEFNKINIKTLLKATIPFILGVMIGMIIILPTLYTLLNGRQATVKDIGLLQLLTPSLGLLYDPYSVGLTLISLISLVIMLFSKKKENKFLSIICLLVVIFPIFNYILNGTLYINSKSLIPFMPLILLLVANTLEKVLKNKINIKQLLLISYIVISAFTVCLYNNKQDELIKKEDINNKEYNTTVELINDIVKQDKDTYRISNLVMKAGAINNVININEFKTTLYSSTYNSDYSTFYFDIFNNPIPHRNRLMTAEVNNILFQTLMSEKYIVTKDNLSLKLIKEKNNIKLYENELVLPIGYSTKNIINENDFDKLNYPNNIINLFNNIVSKEKTNNELIKLDKIKLEYEVTDYNNLTYNIDDIVKVNAEDNAIMNIKLNEDMKDKVLFIRFKNNYNPNKDQSIIINNIQNKLTAKKWKYHNKNFIFDYVLYDTNTLSIEFTKGIYELSDFEFYIVDYKNLVNNNIDEFIIDSIKGDKIRGNINVTNNSYFNLSIPYDKGFKIYVDKKLVEYEKTNKSFIGFKIEKGLHTIEIEYEAPYKKVSLIISFYGIIILIGGFYGRKIYRFIIKKMS